MDDRDLFKPYSPEIRGDLEEYLAERELAMADNLFFGPEYFFEIRDRKLMIPGVTSLRIDRSPIPDLGYFVNSDFLLESAGEGPQNMSLMGAKKGVYDPNDALKDKFWSIHFLDLWSSEREE